MESIDTMSTEEVNYHPAEPDDNLGPLADDEEIGPDGKRNKRKERLEQNRISARESRKRKKTMIEELQRTVITLSRENKDLNDRNEGLRRQLMEIGTKVRSKRDIVFLVRTSCYRLLFPSRRESLCVVCCVCVCCHATVLLTIASAPF